MITTILVTGALAGAAGFLLGYNQKPVPVVIEKKSNPEFALAYHALMRTKPLDYDPSNDPPEVKRFFAACEAVARG